MPPLPTAAPAAADAATKPPKSFSEKVFTLTPVVLTMLATLLAGLSSSEMTQAQYYRALAAQNQSKAGDQWAFFQATRIRGTIVEKALEALPPVAGRVEPADVAGPVQRLRSLFAEADGQAKQLRQAVATAASDLGAAGPSLQVAADAVAVATGKASSVARATADGVQRELARPELQNAFVYLGTDEMPQVQTTPLDDEELQSALAAAREHRPEEELQERMARVARPRLMQAISAAQADARAFEEAGKPVDRVFGKLDQLVRQDMALVHAFHRGVGVLDVYLAEAPASKGQEVRTTVTALDRTDRIMQGALGQLRDYTAARDGYNAHRKREEATYNQRAAGLYEVLVHKNSLDSEQHRRRSRHFFYAMLCAQAGVAIASIGLAAQQKSALWGLASAAGLTAVAFSVYVYLCM